MKYLISYWNMRYIMTGWLLLISIIECYSASNDTLSLSGYFYMQSKDIQSDSLKIQLIKTSHKIGQCYVFFENNKYNYSRAIDILFLDEFCDFKPNPEVNYKIKVKRLSANKYIFVSCDSFDNTTAKKKLLQVRSQVVDSLKKGIFSLNTLVWTDKNDYYYVPSIIGLLDDSVNYYCLDEVKYFADPGGPEYELKCYKTNSFSLRILGNFFNDFNIPNVTSKKKWDDWYNEIIKNAR